MDKIFHVYTSNGLDRYAELELPASDHQLLDLMERLRLEPGKLPYLEILNFREEYNYLEQCIQELPDIFQLNALAKKLSELSRAEDMAAFEGLVGMEIKTGALPVSRLIDFAHSTNCCHVAEDVDTDYKLGRFLAENDFIPETEELSDAAFELLNFAEIGRKHRETEGSVFTSFGYVEQHSDLVEAHKTLDLTAKMPDHAIILELPFTFPLDFEEDAGPQPPVRFGLPACAGELDGLVQAMMVSSRKELVYRCADCRIPALMEMISDAGEEIDHLNHLAQRLTDMDPKALSTYKALLEATDCKDLQSAETLMDSLDEYIFSPQYSSPVEVAKGELSVVLCAEDAAFLAPHLNLYQYGQALIKRCGGSLTAYGLIERKDHQPVQMMEHKPSQGGMEMSG